MAYRFTTSNMPPLKSVEQIQTHVLTIIAERLEILAETQNPSDCDIEIGRIKDNILILNRKAEALETLIEYQEAKIKKLNKINTKIDILTNRVMVLEDRK